jgi:hypothetical protein
MILLSTSCLSNQGDIVDEITGALDEEEEEVEAAVATDGQLTYSSTVFNEDSPNDGSISNSITITLSGENAEFSGSVGDDLVGNGVTISNLPNSLSASVTIASTTQVTFSLSGNADSHANINDVSGLTIVFADSVFANSLAAADVTDSTKSDLTINFNDPPSIQYSTSYISEAAANDGSIDSTITITVLGDTFTGRDGDDFVAASKVSYSNQPPGMTPTITRASSTTLTVAFPGNATNHDDSNDISNFTVTFAASAFTNMTDATEVFGYSKNDIIINFDSAKNMTYSSSQFKESSADDGSFGNSIVISGVGFNFSGIVGSNLYADSKVTVSNHPGGTTPIVTKTSDTTVLFTLSGNATTSTDAVEVSDITINFLDSAFTSSTAADISNSSKSDISVDFITLPISAPTDLEITGMTSNSLSLSWTDNANNETKYHVQTCTGTGCTSSFTVGTTDDSLAANSSNATVGSLTEGNFYLVRVRAENTATQSAWTTLSDPTVLFAGISTIDNGTGNSSKLESMDCTDQYGTYVDLSWTSISGVDNYTLYDDNTSPPTLMDTIAGELSTKLITGFTPGQAYKLRLVANMDNGYTSLNATTTDFTASSTYTPCMALSSPVMANATKKQDLFNPQTLHFYNGKLFVTDTGNDRILIFNSVPTSGLGDPDIVIGQNFSYNKQGTVVGIENQHQNGGDNVNVISAKSLDYPTGVWAGSCGGQDRLIVADHDHHRVLIWNSIPTSNHQAADMVLGQNNFTSADTDVSNEAGMNNPDDVFCSGNKLFISDRDNHRVFVYNSFPTSNGQAPDFHLGQPDASTKTSGLSANEFNKPQGLLVAGTKLLVQDGENRRVLIWNTLPSSGTASADVVIGAPDKTTIGYDQTSGINAGKAVRKRMEYNSSNGKLYIADYGSQVRVYNSIPTTDDASPDFNYGTTSANSNAGNLYYPFDVAALASGGVVILTRGHRLVGHNSVITSDSPTENWIYGQGIVGNRDWNYSSGRTQRNFAEVGGIALDSSSGQFFIRDHRRIMVYNKKPTSTNQAADYVIGQSDFTSMDNRGAKQNSIGLYGRMCTSPGKLWVADDQYNRVMMWNLPITTNDPNANYVLGQTSWNTSGAGSGKTGIDDPRACFWDSANSQFFVSKKDSIMVWSGLPNTLAGYDGANPELHNPAATYIIGTEGSTAPTQTNVEAPSSITVDGNSLYVGDYNNKRYVKYNLPITGDNPNMSLVLGQEDFNSETIRYSGPFGMANSPGIVSHNGYVYAIDQHNRVVIWHNPSTNGEVFHDVLFQSNANRNADRATKAVAPWRITNIWTDGVHLGVYDSYRRRLLMIPLPYK